MNKFHDELRSLINRYSRENGSNTPDYILTKYIDQCLDAFDEATRERDRWYGSPNKRELATTKEKRGCANPAPLAN